MYTIDLGYKIIYFPARTMISGFSLENIVYFELL